MDLLEAGNLSADDEFDHWWIATRFRYAEQVLTMALADAETATVIEFGCGTAQNLRFCRERSRFRHRIARVSGVDPGLAAPVRYDWMRTGDRVDAEDGVSYDVLLAMDVLEHIENDTDALAAWLPHVKSGGYVLITVPAFQWLWSYHDDRLGHVRRHTRSSLERLATGCGLGTDPHATRLRLHDADDHRRSEAVQTDVGFPDSPSSQRSGQLATDAGRVDRGLGRGEPVGWDVGRRDLQKALRRAEAQARVGLPSRLAPRGGPAGGRGGHPHQYRFDGNVVQYLHRHVQRLQCPDTVGVGHDERWAAALVPLG